MKPIVVMSCSSSYARYKDLVCAAWSRMGWDAICVESKKITGITANDAKLARLLAAAEQDDDRVVMLSDIDMLPLNKTYFAPSKIVAGELLIRGYDAYPSSQVERKFPICYTVALGRTWEMIINPDSVSNKKLLKRWRKYRVFDEKESPYTTKFSDESLLRVLIDLWMKAGKISGGPDRTLTAENRGWFGDPRTPSAQRRVGREDWQMASDLLSAGSYIDAHLPRGPDWKEKTKPLADYLGLTI